MENAESCMIPHSAQASLNLNHVIDTVFCLLGVRLGGLQLNDHLSSPGYLGYRA